jgi:O-antigen ligase
MIRYFLLVVFIVLVGNQALGLDIGLAPGVSIKNALLYATAVLIAIDMSIARNRQIELLSVILPFVALIVYATGSWVFIVVFGDFPSYSPFQTLIQLKLKLIDQLIILLVFFYGATNWRDAVWVLKGITWVLLFGCLVTVVDTFNVPDLGIITARTMDGRVEGIIGSAGEFSGMLAFFIPPMVALAWSEKGRARIIAFAGVGLGLISLLVAATRGAMVGLIAGTLAGAVLMRQHLSLQLIGRTAVALLLLVAVSVVVVISTDFGVILQERMSTGLQTGDLQNVSSGRTRIWMDALGDMADSPMSIITGLGWEAYFQSIGRRYATHNVFLDRLYNLGLIGLTLFTLSYVSAVFILRNAVARAPKEATPYLMATVIGMLALMASMLFADLQSAASYSWAYAGLALRIAVSTADHSDAPIDPQFLDKRRTRDLTKLATRPMSLTPNR